jgi:SAM-dependent methyltransferase
MTMAKATPFNERANDYDGWFEKHPELYLAELAAVRSFIPASGNGVEIGVGSGRFAASLGIPIGVEPAPRMAELARQRGIEVLEGVAEALPFVDASFDFAVMVTVVCFLDDVARAFREACRILKPNGTLVIGFIDRESELGQQYSKNKEQSWFYRDATFYSLNEVKVLLIESGFSTFDCRQTLVPGETTDVAAREGHGSGGFVVVRAQRMKCMELLNK